MSAAVPGPRIDLTRPDGRVHHEHLGRFLFPAGPIPAGSATGARRAASQSTPGMRDHCRGTVGARRRFTR
jgi:hypothetical protein